MFKGTAATPSETLRSRDDGRGVTQFCNLARRSRRAVGRALGVARGVFFALAPGRGGGGGGLFSTFHAPAALAAHLRRALDGERANNCIEQFRHRREAHRLFTAHDGLIPNACEGPADEVARLHNGRKQMKIKKVLASVLHR